MGPAQVPSTRPLCVCVCSLDWRRGPLRWCQRGRGPFRAHLHALCLVENGDLDTAAVTASASPTIPVSPLLSSLSAAPVRLSFSALPARPRSSPRAERVIGEKRSGEHTPCRATSTRTTRAILFDPHALHSSVCPSSPVFPPFLFPSFARARHARSPPTTTTTRARAMLSRRGSGYVEYLLDRRFDWKRLCCSPDFLTRFLGVTLCYAFMER